jgi:uncharacterized membrane protein
MKMGVLNNSGGASKTSERTRDVALTSLFAAVIFLMTFTPIGFINLGFIKATIVHVPVIIGSVILGPRIGALLGVMFGLASLINNTIAPVALSFAFSPLIAVPGAPGGSPLALMICFVPRILVGVAPYYVDRFLTAIAVRGGKNWRLAPPFAAGVAGALTNTLLVMHLIYFIFRGAFANVRSVDPDAVYRLVVGVITINGIPEALVAGLLTSAVARALYAYRR